MERRQLTPRRPADPEVDEPAPEVLRIHPPGHPRVARVGYEQREAEVAEQPFRRSLPVALLLPHLEQLARERHVRFVQVDRPAERGPHGDLLRRDVAATLLEALDLAGEDFVLLLPLPQVHAQLGQVVLKTGLVRLKPPRPGPRGATAGGERPRRPPPELRPPCGRGPRSARPCVRALRVRVRAAESPRPDVRGGRRRSRRWRASAPPRRGARGPGAPWCARSACSGASSRRRAARYAHPAALASAPRRTAGGPPGTRGALRPRRPARHGSRSRPRAG